MGPITQAEIEELKRLNVEANPVVRSTRAALAVPRLIAEVERLREKAAENEKVFQEAT